jgi:methyl-accepting chemotaxis protein
LSSKYLFCLDPPVCTTRKLAERSQTAAGKISKLSASSVEVAETAGELLTRLVPDIKKTAELVQEIAAASVEQNMGADQVNSAIQQLNQVIQQNAGAAEEMSSMSEELSSQSEQLASTISFFKLRNEIGRSKEPQHTERRDSIAKGPVSPPGAERPKNNGARTSPTKLSRLPKVFTLSLKDTGNGSDNDFERF